MLEFLRSLFGGPRPAGPRQRILVFTGADTPLTRDGVRQEDGGWRIDAGGARTVRLFEVAGREFEQALLTYAARMRTADVEGGAYLEMWCRIPGRGEFFSRDLAHVVTGTTDWASYETPFYLKRGQRADLLKLNVVLQGRGTVWLRDIELLQTPLH